MQINNELARCTLGDDLRQRFDWFIWVGVTWQLALHVHHVCVCVTHSATGKRGQISNYALVDNVSGVVLKFTEVKNIPNVKSKLSLKRTTNKQTKNIRSNYPLKIV